MKKELKLTQLNWSKNLKQSIQTVSSPYVSFVVLAIPLKVQCLHISRIINLTLKQ